MYTLVATGRICQKAIHPLSNVADRVQLRCLFALPVLERLVDKHAAAIARVAISTVAVDVLTTGAGQRTLGQVQVHVESLELVVVDLIEVWDGAHKVGADVALAVEGLEAAPDAYVLVQRVFGLQVILLVGVDPLFDVDGARAVIQAVGDVGLLRVDGADLAHDSDLCDGVVVDGEVGAGVGFFEIKELFDGYGAEGLVGKALRSEFVSKLNHGG